MMNQESAGLSGSWAHSFEEDEGDVLVYRPSRNFAFPPSRRGRETLDFDAAGQVVTGMPGADDRQRLTKSGLTALGMNRFRLDGADGAAGVGAVIEIVEAAADLLKLRFI